MQAHLQMERRKVQFVLGVRLGAVRCGTRESVSNPASRPAGASWRIWHTWGQEEATARTTGGGKTASAIGWREPPSGFQGIRPMPCVKMPSLRWLRSLAEQTGHMQSQISIVKMPLCPVAKKENTTNLGRRERNKNKSGEKWKSWRTSWENWRKKGRRKSKKRRDSTGGKSTVDSYALRRHRHQFTRLNWWMCQQDCAVLWEVGGWIC